MGASVVMKFARVQAYLLGPIGLTIALPPFHLKLTEVWRITFSRVTTSEHVMEPEPSHISGRLSGKNILVGVSGSVAAIRVPLLVDLLLAEGASVKVITTKHGSAFVQAERPLSRAVTWLKDDDEWRKWRKLSDPVLHIELRKWAHIFLVAPLSANTLAKLTHGICDNLLTCVARAWPVTERATMPFFVAPAMNTGMWDHPITSIQLKSIRAFGLQVIEPIRKKLACGDTGNGAMAEPEAIVREILGKMS
ncbi:Flavoprotein [Gracilaria domingensis]|nr:Flavoprotein [Gracilaria domingensis]